MTIVFMENISKFLNKIRKGYLKEMYKEFKWMLPYARRYWKSICFYIVAGVFGVLMGLGTSLVSKYLLDEIIAGESGRLGMLAGMMAGLAVGNIVSNAIIARISARINVEIHNEIQADIYEKVINSDWEALNEFRSGDLLNRLNNDANQVASSIINWLPGLFTKMVQFVGALIIILYYDPIMALIALVSAPVSMAVSGILVRRMRKHNKEMREISSEIMSFQNDSFQNLQTVKAFGLMDLFRDNLLQIQDDYKGKVLDYTRFSVYTSAFMSMIGLLVSYSCLGWSAYRLWTGYITAGTLMMFISMSGSLTTAFRSLVQLIPQAINATTCAGRLMAVVELEKEKVIEDESLIKISEQTDSGICVSLQELKVIYKEGNQVIENGNFEAKHGQVVAIIGPSGEGKTTLMRIFLGLISPNCGEALLFNVKGDSCPISPATRHLFGYVPQGNTVFAGTIADNMRMIKPDATDEEIIEVLKISCAYDFVKELPKGIYSSIKEHGTGISEGQAQRVSIARALIKDAPILLLDEATSALDMATEQQVLKNIMANGSRKTCIITTHRPSVLEMSDHIYEIKDNNLVKVK